MRQEFNVKGVVDMLKEMMDYIAARDPEVGEAIRAEYARQQRNIELIASENFTSPAVMLAQGSVLTNKYAEGYPGKRYYGGCQCVDVAEELARIQKEIEKARNGLRIVEQKLSNEKFVSRAPEAVVNVEREKAAKLQDLIAKLEESAKAMGG